MVPIQCFKSPLCLLNHKTPIWVFMFNSFFISFYCVTRSFITAWTFFYISRGVMFLFQKLLKGGTQSQSFLPVMSLFCRSVSVVLSAALLLFMLNSLPLLKLLEWHTAGLSLSLLRCAGLVRLIAHSGFTLATKVKAAKKRKNCNQFIIILII